MNTGEHLWMKAKDKMTMKTKMWTRERCLNTGRIFQRVSKTRYRTFIHYRHGLVVEISSRARGCFRPKAQPQQTTKLANQISKRRRHQAREVFASWRNSQLFFWLAEKLARDVSANQKENFGEYLGRETKVNSLVPEARYSRSDEVQMLPLSQQFLGSQLKMKQIFIQGIFLVLRRKNREVFNYVLG